MKIAKYQKETHTSYQMHMFGHEIIHVHFYLGNPKTVEIKFLLQDKQYKIVNYEQNYNIIAMYENFT